jgi:hypothetical protein
MNYLFFFVVIPFIMETSTSNEYQRKSSCATVVPPSHSRYQARKSSLVPLRINTAGTKNLFFDSGSMNEISPTTIVSIPEEVTTAEQHISDQPEQKTESFFQKLKQKLKRNITSSTTTEKNLEYYKKKHALEKQHRPVQHSYSDPHLSPGSTAVGDDEEEHHDNSYFGSQPQKKSKRSPRGWIAAVLMIVFGALIALTFILVGLGKALGGNGHISSIQSNSNQTTSNNSSLYIPSASIYPASSSIVMPTPQITSPIPSSSTLPATQAVTFVLEIIEPTTSMT